MNNDFNFRPTRPSQSSPSSDETAGTPEEMNASQNDAAETPAPQQQAVVTSKQPSGAVKRFFKGLLLFILIVLAAGGVYYWQQSQVQTLTKSQKGLQSQVSTLQAALAKEKAAGTKDDTAAVTQPATTYNVITGSVTNNVGNAADVTVQYLPGTAKEVWVEYGSKPDDLKQATKHFAATSEGTAGTYVEQAATLTGLQTGTKYFYRAAGTVNDKTVYGGIVSFTATK